MRFRSFEEQNAPNSLSPVWDALDIIGGKWKQGPFMPEKPDVVEYAVTKYGRSLDSVITAYVNWGITHRDKCKNS